jgi:hypothetical protein
MASLAAAAAQQRRRSGTLTFCAACHFLPGVYSFNTFTQNFPGEAGGASAPLSAMPVRDVVRSAVTWKLQRAAG